MCSLTSGFFQLAILPSAVSTVLELAEKDQSEGTVDKEELLPALARWKEDMSATDWAEVAAQRKATENATKSSACSIL